MRCITACLIFYRKTLGFSTKTVALSRSEHKENHYTNILIKKTHIRQVRTQNNLLSILFLFFTVLLFNECEPQTWGYARSKVYIF